MFMDLSQTWYDDKYYCTLYLILVFLTLTLIMVTGVQKSLNVGPNYLTNVSIDLKGIWYAIETC